MARLRPRASFTKDLFRFSAGKCKENEVRFPFKSFENSPALKIYSL